MGDDIRLCPYSSVLSEDHRLLEFLPPGEAEAKDREDKGTNKQKDDSKKCYMRTFSCSQHFRKAQVKTAQTIFCLCTIEVLLLGRSSPYKGFSLDGSRQGSQLIRVFLYRQLY